MKNTRIYGRFSSKPQERGDSKRRQIDGAIAYAAKNGLKVVGEPYFDEAVSGKAGANLELEFGRILADSEEGDTILCEFLDRVGRQSPFLIGKLLYDTAQKGITVIAWAEGKTINRENIDKLDTMFGVFTGTAIGFNENQRKMTRMKEVNTESYINGENGIASKNITKYLPTCYTWDESTKTIIQIPEKATVIQRIFNEFCEGFGKTVICQHLNNDNIPTVYSHSPKWLETSIAKILKNEAYAGTAHIKGHTIKCFKGVISSEQFARTQNLIARWSKRYGKQGDKIRVNNLFKDIMVCAHCGGKLRVNCTLPKKEGLQTCYSYQCRNAKVKTCGIKKMVNATNVELFFFSEFLGGDGSQLKSKSNGELQQKKESVTYKIEQAEKAISNLYDMVENGDTEAKNRIAKRKEEKEALQAELQAIKGAMAEADYIPTMIDRLDEVIGKPSEFKSMVNTYYPTLRAKLSDNNVRRELAVILPSFVKKITVDMEENSFFAELNDGTTTKTINVTEAIEQLKDEGIPFK